MNIENYIDGAMADFCPYGYLDIKRACTVILEAEPEAETGRLYEIVNDFVDNTGMSVEDIDPVACVYDEYHQTARTDIERLTDKDICNDAPYHGVNVIGNYMCTTFDGKEEDIQALRDLIETIPAEDRTDAIKWLYNTI